jgi:hypothetical protein
MTNPINSAPYLRTSREFPEDLQPLAVQLTKSYIEIANAVNNRTISLFPVNRPAITGESWFLRMNQRQQTLRQVYTFTTTAAIDHGISVTDTNQFTHCYGSYTDGTNSFGLFWTSSVAIAGQLTFYITSTQIVFLVGAGSPVLTDGKIILEWLSSV